MQPDYQALAASAGWAIGTAHVLAAHALVVPHVTISPDQVAAEQSQLRAAFAATLAELAALRQSLALEKHTEISAFIEVHELMLHDPVLVDETLAYIAQHSVNAAWALSEQVQTLAATFTAMDDAYLRERAFDVQQVGERVLAHLNVSGEDDAVQPAEPLQREHLILVCRDLAPADFVQWQRANVCGLLTEVGGVSSHTAIVARAQGLPAVLAVPRVTQWVQEGDTVVLDGGSGQVWVNPSESVLTGLRARLTDWQNGQAAAQAAMSLPAVTMDGQRIEVLANIEGPQDMAAVALAHLDGVGLMRSEFLFMGREQLPTEDEQYEAYRSVVEALRGKSAVIRTLDVGADKLLNSAHSAAVAASPNPALGLRAVRYSLAEPDVFLTQLRALLRAGAHGPVKVLLPMVATVAEVLACRALIERASSALLVSKQAFAAVELGIMVEIPAVAIAIDAFLPHVDFCSIGTNDLIQYTLAIDRTDGQVAYLYDPLHLALTRLIGQVIQACHAAGKHVSVCGEMAGDAAMTHHLLTLGLKSFSLNAGQAGAVKAAIRRWPQNG